MSSTRVCTLMWGAAFDRYGRRFVETFQHFWPDEAELVIVTDTIRGIGRATEIPLQAVPGYEVIATWADNRKARGFDSGHRKTDANGYSWRHDAVKWAPQGLAPRAALEGLDDGDVFIWLDADVETIRSVPKDWGQKLLGAHDVACLKRPSTHSEIGFYAMRMGDGTRAVLERFGALYASGDVFGLPEYHSAFVWDRALETERTLRVRNLNDRNQRGHCWPATPLARYTRHKKGKLKNA